MSTLLFLTVLLASAEPDPATQLAERVHRAAGGDRLAEVAELRFSFVVVKDDKKVAEIRHRWDLKNARDRVTWTDRTGKARDVIVDLRSKPSGNEDAEKAYARWINDSYWLMLPTKLLDPGVKRTLEEKREQQGKKYEVLRLEFEKVGLTPGDRYWLFIDPASAHIERWEMVLEGQKPPAEAFSFGSHTKIGPLTLALDDTSADGKEHIRFEGVEALSAIEPSDFSK